MKHEQELNKTFGNSNDVHTSKNKTFFLIKGVDDSCKNPIEIIFDTLIYERGEKPYDWYKTLMYDKGFASKVRRGLLIPKLEDRIKIAKYFKTDSTAIWRIKDLDYIKLVLKKQKRSEGFNCPHPNNQNKSGDDDDGKI